MFTVIATALLAAAPVIVVAPFEVNSVDPADADLGLALQSLVEADLAGAGLQSRTEDDLDPKNWGKIKTANHIVTGTIMPMGKRVIVLIKMIEPVGGAIDTNVKLKGADAWNERRQFVDGVLKVLALPVPPKLEQLVVTDELVRAWGAALRAIHSGDPKVAKEKVAAVVKRWPDFALARARLDRL
jgi:TolB-like protein